MVWSSSRLHQNIGGQKSISTFVYSIHSTEIIHVHQACQKPRMSKVVFFKGTFLGSVFLQKDTILPTLYMCTVTPYTCAHPFRTRAGQWSALASGRVKQCCKEWFCCSHSHVPHLLADFSRACFPPPERTKCNSEERMHWSSCSLSHLIASLDLCVFCILFWVCATVKSCFLFFCICV